jgi:hypothetical protein
MSMISRPDVFLPQEDCGRLVPKAYKEGRNIGLKPMQFAIFWMSINLLVL